MILEVNNTFDERRIYFLKGPSQSSQSEILPSLLESDMSTCRQGDSKDSYTRHDQNGHAKFKSAWVKDFHVSPFNSRKGSYSLVANDPFPLLSTANCVVDNTVTLNSSKNHPKLIARVFSTESPVDPTTLTSWKFVCFVLSWWWVGLVTFPRIIKEAGKLFFRRKLHVWLRPEVLKDSIGRKETQRERFVNIQYFEFS